MKSVLQDLFAEALVLVPAGAAMSVVLPWDWWRCGVALFGANVALSVIVTTIRRRR